MTALVRESISEKISRIERKQLEEDMRAAYQGLAEENARLSEEFRYVDSERLTRPGFQQGVLLHFLPN